MREAKLSGRTWLYKRVLPDVACRLVANLVIQSPREQPAHTKHVDRRAHRAIAQAIFGLTKAARPMVHWNFNQPVARAFDQRGNKAMHSLEWNERGDAFGTHRFECAAGVAHTVFCITAADRVRDPAGKLFHNRVPALRAITANQIGAARNFIQQSWNVSGIILQIAVNQDEDPPRAQPGARRRLRRFARHFFRNGSPGHSA